KTGKLVALKEVLDTDDLMIVNKSGIVIRINVNLLRVMGRATQGVRLIKIREDDSIASVTPIEEEKGNGVTDPVSESFIADQTEVDDTAVVDDVEEIDDTVVSDDVDEKEDLDENKEKEKE
ncbi:MAG TPA: DNA gyrase C-terminal beta-propeller domain-containing protein, partial [Bacteroidales bacterium]|nr:DNA gyrase C-terminal beta-propeller domain-containing protein [Bacteroidales bacterium]